MSDKIRGLTVEIVADGSKFKKTMSDLRSDAKSSQQQLNALQKSLQLEFNDEKFAKAQQIAQQALDDTSKSAYALQQRIDYLKKEKAVDTKEYQKLQTELEQTKLKAEQLEQQLEELNNLKFDDLSKKVTKVGGNIEKVGKTLMPLSAVATGTMTSLGMLGAKAVSTADDIATTATKYDMPAESLQRFNYVALQTDTANEDLYKGFVKARSAIADIAGGTTSIASTALKKLNLDLNSFDGSDEQFYAIVNALSSMEDKTQMVGIANDIFGDKLANNLLPLIYSGAEAINAYRAEYDELGAMSNEQVTALAEFDNVLNKIKTQLSNVVLQIGASLLPIMQTLANVISENIVPKLQSLAQWFNSLSGEQQEFALKALIVVAALAPVITIVGKLTSCVGSFIKIIPTLNSSLAKLAANPIVLIIAAVAGILVLLYSKCEAFRESINLLVSTLSTALSPILNLVMGVLQQLMGLLTPIIDLLGGILGAIITMIVEALSPLFEMISLITQIIQPLIEVALLPLQMSLTALQVPLQVLGQLLAWLAPLFKLFGTIVTTVFKAVVAVINFVLGMVEDAINWCIDKINKLIDGVNNALGWLGVNISHIGDVSLKLNTADIDSLDDVQATIDATPPVITPETTTPDQVYNQVDTSGIAGDIYNYDNSTSNTTQNVTVTIQNYAQEVDVDDLVHQINVKLAEAM